MNPLKKTYLLLREKSLKYFLFRLNYELERKSGVLALRFPNTLSVISSVPLSVFRNGPSKYLFDNRKVLDIPKKQSRELDMAFHRVESGDVLFFSKQWYHLGDSYDWVTNPESGYHYNIAKHWTTINDLSKEAGDIKFVWEKSRFSFLYTIIRYDYHFGEDHSEFAIGQILDWIEKNPLNCGPNYKCSQEISLRVLNWIFALNFYKNSEALTDVRWSKILSSIYWQIDHVYKNINFSRIAVRNNHAITETLTLYLVGLLFPSLPDANKWKSEGKRWFEKEVLFQIADDGTYIQDSMNYHRVVVQLLTLAIALADRNGEKFSDSVYEKAYKSVNFLYQCQELSNGALPNYGANDGALFFPLSDNDYRDFRPQLDALYNLLVGKSLYNNDYEDKFWISSNCAVDRQFFPEIKQQSGIVRFDNSGYYLIREIDSLSFFRCGRFNGKGGCTDELHLDLWYQGDNCLFDCGSYKYNTDDYLEKYFRGTESHNTIMLDDYDQMLKGPHFIWFYKPRIRYVKVSENKDSYVLSASIIAFAHLGNNITINRIVRKLKWTSEWSIEDIILNKPEGVKSRQLWHTNSKNVHFETEISMQKKSKWYSSYYGSKSDCHQIEFVSLDPVIKTKIVIE